MNTPHSSIPNLHANVSPDEFHRECRSFLCINEAQNNGMLGISGVLGTPSSPYKDFYLAYYKGESGIEGGFMMTPPHPLGLSYPCSERAIDAAIDDLIASGRTLPGIVSHIESAHRFVDAWTKKKLGTAEIDTHLFCYKLSAVNIFEASPGDFRRATMDDLELIIEWARGFAVEADLAQTPDNEQVKQNLIIAITEGRFFLWIDKKPVAMLRATGPTPTGIRINSVYTPPDLRRKGYASSLVGKVSDQLLKSGRKFCFLFTDAKNPTSNKIYQQLGYHKVCEFMNYDLHKNS